MPERRAKRRIRLAPVPPIKPRVPKKKEPMARREEKWPPSIPEAKRMLVAIRKRYIYRAPTDKAVIAEIKRLERLLRGAGITHIGAPSRRRLKK